jgi:hypothetical protein
MSSAQSAAEASFASPELNDHMLRRQATALLQVTGDRELLVNVAEARPLAAVGDGILQQALAGEVTQHVVLEAQ